MNNNKQKLFIFPVLLFLLLLPIVSNARVGVSLSNGKIEYKELMRAGAIYTLPALSVGNNGDETATYTVLFEYIGNSKLLQPQKEWFSFSPETFVIDPGKGQLVNVKMTLPLDAVPGDYKGFLTAMPVKASTPGSSSVGIAVAAKLYFTIAPSNIFEGIYYRVISLIHTYAPWTYVVFGVIALAALLKVIGRYISFDVTVKKKSK
ncbi:MAG: hypothetical protein V1902_01320 [Candidatus Falkowbacteria bacterium]